MKNIDVTDELLYKYMPIADEKAMAALEEQLNDEEIILSPKFEKRMKRLMWREKHKWVVEFGKFIIKVAVVCLCILGVSFAVTMSVDAYRSKFFQTVQELLGDESALHTYDVGDDEQGFVPHEPTYIPEGYVEVERYQTSDILTITYVNAEMEYILWDQKKVFNSGWQITDTEYKSVEHIKMDGGLLTIYCYENGYKYAYYETTQYTFLITADNMDVGEIIEVMSSIN